MNNRYVKGDLHLERLYQEIVSSRDEYSDKTGSIVAHPQLISTIGYLLHVTHQIGSCEDKCYGGPHILQALSGRAHNLGRGALELIHIGYYDESLNLIRSIGEIGNLLTLFAHEPQQYKDWIVADKKQRLKNYGPKKVRDKIRSYPLGKIAMLDDWYSTLCEKYVHVTPETIPNCHNIGSVGKVGGQYQQQGVQSATKQLFESLLSIVIAITMIFRISSVENELQEIADLLREVGS